MNNLIFAFKTLVASKIYKRPNLITLFYVNNKVIRLKYFGYCYSTNVKKTKIRFQRYLAATETIFVLSVGSSSVGLFLSVGFIFPILQ